MLGEHLNISLNEMVAIGDSMEDLEIIENVGLGVAMGNSPVELKQAADWITRSNSENGVEYMIKEHFRKQFPLPFLKNHKIHRNDDRENVAFGYVFVYLIKTVKAF